MPKEEKARLWSVYFRPWTLFKDFASPTVPYLASMDICTGARKRMRGKTATEPVHDAEEVRDWRVSWRTYLAGNIVSDHAARIIKNVLLGTLAEGRRDDDSDGEEVDKNNDVSIGHSTSTERIHELIKSSATDVENDVSGKVYSDKMQGAMKSVIRMLAHMQQPLHESRLKASRYIVTLNRKQPSAASKRAPTNHSQDGVCTFYDIDFAAKSDAFHASLQSSAEPPTGEQMGLLARVHARCVEERTEEAVSGLAQEHSSAPMMDLVHGLPGSGKTKLITMIFKYFEEVWGWTHGNEFVGVAPMNSMAGNIGGFTLHSFGGLAFYKDGVWVTAGAPRTQGPDAMVTKCQRLRFLVVDECENGGAKTLAELEGNVARAVPDGSRWKWCNKTVRYFGGVNVLWVGDFWQLPPPGEIALMGNPYKGAAICSEAAQRMLALFWTNGEESVRRPPTELTINHRSGSDVWYSSVIEQCRVGALKEDDYNFLHGYPTLCPGSTVRGECLCGNPRCKMLSQTWREQRVIERKSLDPVSS